MPPWGDRKKNCVHPHGKGVKTYHREVTKMQGRAWYHLTKHFKSIHTRAHTQVHLQRKFLKGTVSTQKQWYYQISYITRETKKQTLFSMSLLSGMSLRRIMYCSRLNEDTAWFHLYKVQKQEKTLCQDGSGGWWKRKTQESSFRDMVMAMNVSWLNGRNSSSWAAMCTFL